jgi:hypothetical protein
MILVDTGALYALSLPVMVEAGLFLEARLGAKAARALWDDVRHGVFHVMDVSDEILARARAIDRKYADAEFGFVDSVTFALCEHHRIGTVFTYDRRHFSLYRPSFQSGLRLVP